MDLSLTVENVPIKTYDKLNDFMYSKKNKIDCTLEDFDICDSHYSKITNITKGQRNTINVNLRIKGEVSARSARNGKTPRRVVQEVFDILGIFPE